MKQAQFHAGQVIKKANGLALGKIFLSPAGGFYFLPYTTAHRSSRKSHDTPDACVPAWVMRILKKEAK